MVTVSAPHGGGDSGGGDGVKLPGGKKVSPKILIGLVGVVVVLLVVMRARSGGGAAADSSGTAGSGSYLDAAEQAMLAQLQSDNANTIQAQLSQIPAGARGPTGPPGARGPVGTHPFPLPHPHPIPPGTVHKPAKHPAGGGSGMPTPKGHFYTVKAGDTVSGIAKKWHIKDWHKLLNSKTDKSIRDHPNLIHPGQKIWIPG